MELIFTISTYEELVIPWVRLTYLLGVTAIYVGLTLPTTYLDVNISYIGDIIP